MYQNEINSIGRVGDCSSRIINATGAARVMLERAFPQDEQTSVQGQMADAQGVAQNTAAPVVNGQPVYSDLALADYMAKQAARQKFGDATRSDAEIQQAGVTKAEVQPELEHTTTAIPEENVVASAQNDGTIEETQLHMDHDIQQEIIKYAYKVVNLYAAQDSNQWFIDHIDVNYQPPYKLGTTVVEIELAESTTFVRVYDNLPDRSGMRGSWMMRAEEIKGLSPIEIQDKFALPNTPKYICDVELEAGTHMRIGIANSLPDWGTGGGIQYDLMGQRIGIFKNERLIGDGKNV